MTDTDNTGASNDIDKLIETRIKIASTETKSEDSVVQIAWLADGIGVWFRTDGERGHSPEEARRFIISSITRLLAQEATKARLDEASHYCDEGHFHDNDRDLAMLPSERVAELTAHKESKE